MRLSHAKADSAKDSSNIRSVILRRAFFGQNTFFHEPVQAEESNYIGFGFFQAAISGANGFTNVALAGAGAGVIGTQAMRDFMHQDGGEITIHCGNPRSEEHTSELQSLRHLV